MATIEKRSGNSYRITVSCGYDKNGKQIRKKKTVSFPEDFTEKQKVKEAKRQAILFEREVQNGTYLDGENVTFSEFSQVWITDYAEKELAPKTVERYKGLLTRINAQLGNLKLCKIQPPHIFNLMNNLSKNGARIDHRYIMKDKYISRFIDNSKELSGSGIHSRTIENILNCNPTNKKTACKMAEHLNIELLNLFNPHNTNEKLSSQTLLHHFRLLSAILNTAMQWNLILNNPADRAKAPRVEQKEIQSLDDNEIIQMLDLLESESLKYQAAVYIAVFGGLRLGEVMGLRWSDLDYITGKINVSRIRQYVNGLTIEKSPKNDTSKRSLTLPNTALSKLHELKKEQTAERLKLGSDWINSGYIFIKWNGEPMFPKTIGDWFTKWIYKTELPYITFHGLRHSNASLLVANGTNIATVSKRLGHSRISTTTDIYTHSINKMDEEAAETLENIFTTKRTS